MLKRLETPMTPEEVASAVGMPLFRIRSGLREMSEAGLVMPEGEKYRSTELGLEKAAQD
jgi:predicted transcriptional regulator